MTKELTPRELDVLRALAQQPTAKKAAVSLGISYGYVRDCQWTIAAKWGCTNRLATILMLAAQKGLV